MEKDKCFVCFEDNSVLYSCCHICSCLACNNCIDTMNNLYKNKCTICNSFLPLGYKRIETGNSEKMSITMRPKIFYLETDKKPECYFYSVKIKDKIIENILQVKENNGKYFLLNSNFPFHYFETFSILFENNITIKSIGEKIISDFFIPEIFIGAKDILHITGYDNIKILYRSSIIYRNDFERICKRNKKKYFTVTDNIFFRNLREDESYYENCCIFL